MQPNDASLSALLATGLDPLARLWNTFIDYLPQIVGAIIIFGVGWIIASVVARILQRVLHRLGTDRLTHRAGIAEGLESSLGARYAAPSNLVALTVKWLLILGAFGIAAEALNLPQVNQFVGAIFGYIPNVIAAAFILVVGFFGARIVADFVLSAIGATRLPGNPMIIRATMRYSIMALAVMAALTQLNIVPQLIEILFAGFVLALALAFGLGGRDHADAALRSLREQRRA